MRAMTRSVPFLDLAAQYDALREDLVQAVVDVADSGTYVLGPRVEDFETRFAAYVEADHCIAVSSGTAALHLALIAAGVGPGDEVITVPMTFVATSWAITYVGATPVFVDVDPDTCTMDVGRVEAAITEKTRAILPVHLYGQAAHLEGLLELGHRYGIPVIEDAAQAHGATYDGRPVGVQSGMGCFSFYPGKNLGAFGEGGAVVTDDGATAARLQALRDHAQSTKYHHDELGFNYRMDAMQGAVLGVKLGHLDDWIAGRRRVASRYREALVDVDVRLPVESQRNGHVWHLYVIRHGDRDRLAAELLEAGVHTGLHYPVPVHLQPAYRHLGHRPGDFPVAEAIAQSCLSLPMYPELDDGQIDHVCEAVAEAARNRSTSSGSAAL